MQRSGNLCVGTAPRSAARFLLPARGDGARVSGIAEAYRDASGFWRIRHRDAQSGSAGEDDAHTAEVFTYLFASVLLEGAACALNLSPAHRRASHSCPPLSLVCLCRVEVLVIWVLAHVRSDGARRTARPADFSSPGRSKSTSGRACVQKHPESI